MFTLLAPRQPVLAAPYAVHAANAELAFRSGFWTNNNNASNLVQGVNANAGTNQWAVSLIPPNLTNQN